MCVCDSKKSKFIKQKEASGLLSSLGIKTSLNKIPLLGPLLYQLRPQSSFKKIALAPHDFAGNFYLI